MSGDLRRLLPRLGSSARRFGDIARCGECGSVLIVIPSESECRQCGAPAPRRR